MKSVNHGPSRPITLALVCLALAGCASTIEPRHLETDRSAYYPLAVLVDGGAIDITGKTYRLAHEAYAGSDECIRGLDFRFGIMSPMCPATIAADMEIQRKIKQLNEEFARDTRAIRQRLVTFVGQGQLREHAENYLNSHGADAKIVASASNSAELVGQGYAMSLELSLRSVDFSERELQRNEWSYCLRMGARGLARALAGSDVLADEQALRMICQPYDSWLEEGEVENIAAKLYRELSAQLIDEILLLHRDAAARPAAVAPQMPAEPTGPGTANPAKPVVRGDFHACCYTPFAEIGLEPLLQWSPLDRTGVTDVGYDIQVLDARINVGRWLGGDSAYKPFTQFIVPWHEVYARADLDSVSHRLETKLEPCSWYFWRVRARYRLDGFPRVSAWSDEKHPGDGNASLYPVRTRAGDDAPDCWNETVDWSVRKASRY